MRISWIAACRDVRRNLPTVDVLGINQAGAMLYEDPPVEVTVMMAVCIVTEPGEVESGAVVSLLGNVWRADGSRAGWREETIYTEEADPLPPDFERPVIYDFPITFEADALITYRIEVALEGQDPLSVAYFVRRLPTL